MDYRTDQGLRTKDQGPEISYPSPGVIEYGIEAIESATFLTPEQKRDILYNNAARFLRFTPEQISRHHGR